MALIEGAHSKIIADVDGPNSLALDTVIKQRDVVGAFVASGITGLMVAPVINSAVFAIRNGPASGRKMYITEIYMNVVNTSASTGAAAVTWDMMMYSGTNFQQQGNLGGTTTPIYGILNKQQPSSPGSFMTVQSVAAYDSAATPGGWAGGQISVCNTAGLTSGSVLKNTTNLCTILPYNCTTTTPLLNSSVDAYIQNTSGMEHPIELLPGTGVFIQNSVAMGTSVQMYSHVRMQWYEVQI
jgi:hypothetical protein